MDDLLVSSDILKSGAVASWSGFVYQGKVAIYQAVSMLINNIKSESFVLKVEHLDDFAIFNEDNVAVSIHQVKATQSPYRSKYLSALKQAVCIESYHVDENTKRYFHVSAALDDFSLFSEESNNVEFYEYHTCLKYVAPDGIEELLRQRIKTYLQSNGLSDTEHLVQYKLDKLNALVANKVNYAHAINQSTKKNQFESTDITPINFTDILECLRSEVLNIDDCKYLLTRFKSKFLQVIDEYANYYGSEPGEDELLVSLSNCKTFIAGLNLKLVEKLYYSLDPRRMIVLPEEGQTDIDRYLNIIYNLPGLLSENNLPHYYSRTHGKYLPSSIELKGISKKPALKKMNKNLDELRQSNALLDVLFEFDNLIVDISEHEFALMDQPQQKFTHNSDMKDLFAKQNTVSLQYKITKAKNVRFVSTEVAKGEL